jgi:hypothetical protein
MGGNGRKWEWLGKPGENGSIGKTKENMGGNRRKWEWLGTVRRKREKMGALGKLRRKWDETGENGSGWEK